MFDLPAPAARLPQPYRDEFAVLAALLKSLQGQVDWPAAVRTARPWVQSVRDNPAPSCAALLPQAGEGGAAQRGRMRGRGSPGGLPPWSP